MKKTISVALLALVSLATSANAQSITYNSNNKTVTVTASNSGDMVEVKSSWWGKHRVTVELEYWDASEDEFEDIKRTFDMDEVDHIVFEGGDGDDIFVCEDDDDMDFDCDLRGGDGLDLLVGGPNADTIDGGHDGNRDILEGGLGADRFVRWYELEERPFPVRFPQPTWWFPFPVFGQTIAPFVIRVYEYENNVGFYAAEGDTVDAREAL